ncbi:MAG: type III-B CRISPR module RAMP protein Cmr1 [Pseudomonadota bacterium]|nr:type III-B CRISPR module RAMP protein Cmr1 [Pseudomonadota bacterium]
MAINISRFYGRERIELDCEILTPMFLGGADQNAELRAASFKGLLRYWWRIACGYRFHSATELYSEEAKLFGSPDDDSGKSKVMVEVLPGDNLIASKAGFKKLADIKHPEVTGGKVNPLNYLAGMGLIKGAVQHSYFQPGGHFRLKITASPKYVEEVLALFKAFGAAGGRSRNGWGSLNISAENGFFNPSANALQTLIKPFNDAFNCDYPHCLGADTKGLLLWKTKGFTKSWEDCLRELADIYVKIRLVLNIKGPKGKKQDRHLLGYPVTNHTVQDRGWNKQTRHASALRLLVRKSEGGLCSGYILHIPHLFSKKLWGELDAGKQKKIWRQVHAQLDSLMFRATMEVLL